MARVEPTGQAATVYNLTIEGLATYYVTTTTNTPTLVHNAYGTQVEYGSTELSRAVQAARLEARDRSHNYAAALLSDPQHTIIVARSRGKYVHAEDALEELRGDVAIKSLILGLNLVLENVDLASNKPELRLLILGPGTQVTSAIVRELQSLMP